MEDKIRRLEEALSDLTPEPVSEEKQEIKKDTGTYNTFHISGGIEIKGDVNVINIGAGANERRGEERRGK